MNTDTRAQVWAKTNGRCWYCGKAMNPWNDFSIDHMHPRAQGGDDTTGNLVPCCKTCNSRKRAKTVEEFRSYLIEKQHVQFWGEHALEPRKALETLPSVVTDTEHYPRPYTELVELCIQVTPYENSTLAITLLGLMRLAEKWGADPDRCGGRFTFDDLQAVTHIFKPKLLSNLYILEAYPPLTLAWGSEEQLLYFILDFSLLDYMQPEHWKDHDDFSEFVSFFYKHSMIEA